MRTVFHIANTVSAAVILVVFSGQMKADTTSFEQGQTFLLRTGNSGVASQVCGTGDPVHTGLCSAQLYLPNSGADSAAAGIVWNGSLGSIYSSVWAYVPSTSPQLLPYLDYYVDSNRDGSIEAVPQDSLVILDESSAFSANTWTYEVLDGSSLVHVYGNRPGLTGDQVTGEFSTSNPGTLDALLATALPGGGTWADLIVMRVRAEAGSWGGSSPAYTAYVDDLTVSAPEPGGIALLVTMIGAVLMLPLGRRLLSRA